MEIVREKNLSFKYAKPRSLAQGVSLENRGEWKNEVGDFEYIQKLGEGGFGEVWLASDPKRGEKVAVKILKFKNGGAEEIDLFKREFEILAELKQVHLARVFDFGFSPENERYFLTTEYCPGQNLLKAIQGKPVAYFEEILVQLLTALEFIHSQGILHFDIKPDNILVQDMDGRPNVKLVDFGVAVRMKALPEELGGTLAFVAPEVLERSPKIDHRADLYSVGMLCLFCLTKRLPFAPSDYRDIMDWHQSGKISPHLWKDREVPPYLREITEKLLAKNPADRFSNSRVVLNFLNLATGGKYRREEEELEAQIPLEGPLVERQEEILRPLIRDLERCLFSQEGGPLSSVAFIWGERGSGKSRILDEIRHFIQVKEVPFLQIECNWNVPAWPKLEKTFGIRTFSTDALDQTWQTRRRMDALIEAAKRGPICILVDDFHKADPETKNLILELGVHTRSLHEAGRAPPLFVLVATEEEMPGAHALSRLSPEGITRYLQLVLGESLPLEKLSEVLYQYSGGVPVLVVEGLRYLAPHFFRGESLETLLTPANIHLLYEEKLEKLKSGERDLLDIAALLFRPATEGELGGILGPRGAHLLEWAIPCCRAGLMRGNLYGQPVFQVSSQALALDIISGLDPERRGRLHLKIAQGLAGLPGIALQELAYHWAKGGEAEQALDSYQRAGRNLEREGKISSASDCLRKAMDLMKIGSSEWQRLALRVFRLLVVSGNYQEAEKFPRILENFPSWEREESQGLFYLRLRKYPQARESYLAALHGLPENEWLHRILMENALANIDLQEGRPREGAERLRKTLAWEERLSEEERHKVTNNSLGMALSLLGEHEEAIRFYQNRLQSVSGGNVDEELGMLNGIGFSLLQGSRYEESISYLKRALSLAEGSGALHGIFSIMGNLLTALLKGNRYVEALSSLKKMASYQRRFGTPRDISYNLLRQGCVYILLGMGEFALNSFQEGQRLAQDTSDAMLVGWFLLMRGYWEREFGELEKAGQYFKQAEDEAIRADNKELLAWTHYGLAENAFDEGKIQTCREFLEGSRFQTQDEEFATRQGLLRAKITEEPDALYVELEERCRRNHFRELLWEVYQFWGNSLLKRGKREEAAPLFEKGHQVIQEISSALPEEYRDRYLHQRSRRKFFDDRDKALRAHQPGLISRIKMIHFNPFEKIFR